MKNIIEWLYLRQTNNLAYYDRLTQLLNRNWWELYAKKILTRRIVHDRVKFGTLEMITPSRKILIISK